MKKLKTLLVILLLASTTACGSAETNKSITASSTQGTQRSSEQNALRKTNNTLSEILLMVEEGYQIVFDQPGAEHVTVD